MSPERGFFIIRLNVSFIRGILIIVKLFVSAICCSILDLDGISMSSLYSVAVLTKERTLNKDPGLAIS